MLHLQDEIFMKGAILSTAPIARLSTRTGEQAHQVAKFAGAKRANHAGDGNTRVKAVLEQLSTKEAFASLVTSATPSTRSQALPIMRKSSTRADGVRLCRGVWIASHRVYVGNWLNVYTNPNSTCVGALHEVLLDANDRCTLRIRQYVADRGDCASTGLPKLRANGSDVLDFRLAPPLVVEVVCVSKIRNEYRWNTRIPPVKLTV